MSPEQRQAAAERLALAREKKQRDNPPQNLSLHESIRNLDPKHPLHPNEVKKWVKTQKDLRAEYKKMARKNTKGALARYYIHDGYIKSMEKYLRTGEWMDMFYGEHQDKKMSTKCIALAYYHKGKYEGYVKRTVGVFYPDIGCRWTVEMDDEYYK